MSIKGTSKGSVYSKLISISGESDQIEAGGTGTNFTVNLGSNLQLVTSCSVLTCTFPNSWYNIRLNSNDTYSYFWSGTGLNYTYRLTPGFYTLSQILSLLNTNLTANAAGFAQWSFNPTTNLVSLTATGDGVNYLTYNPSSLGGLTNTLGGGNLALIHAFGTLGNVLALNATDTITGSTFPRLGGLDHVYVQSRTMAPAHMIEFGGKFLDSILLLPVTAPFGTLQVFECKQDALCEITYGRPRDFSKIDIRLTDTDGNIIDLNGGHIHLCMRVWYNVS